MSDQPKTSLRRKLFLAAQDAQPVAKNGHSDEGRGFDFVRYEDVLAEASRVLGDQGVLIVPEAGEPKLVFGRKGCIATVPMVFEICDSESDETILKNWVGTGFDSPGHKAVYAAVTGGEKYFLVKLLNIPVGIDPEGDGEAKDSQKSAADEARAKQDAVAEAPDIAPIVEPATPSVENEIPADASGLGLEPEGVR